MGEGREGEREEMKGRENARKSEASMKQMKPRP